MGGRGSGRWREHQKAPLVEDSLAIDLVALRRSGALAEPKITFEMTWTAGGEVVGVAKARLGRVSDCRRSLLLNTVFAGADEPLQVRLDVVSFAPNFGGIRWFLLCPEAECGRRTVRLYVDVEGQRFGCRQCLGLTHRSVQQHDARLDQARRDPDGFRRSRADLHGRWSGVVTFGLEHQAFEARAAPRRGRGWATASTTFLDRVHGDLVRDWERRHRRPFPGRSLMAEPS